MYGTILLTEGESTLTLDAVEIITPEGADTDAIISGIQSSVVLDWFVAARGESTGNLYAWSSEGFDDKDPAVIAFSDGDAISFSWWGQNEYEQWTLSDFPFALDWIEVD